MDTLSDQNDPALWTDSLAKDLLVFLIGRVKCPDIAADLTQETLLRFHKFVKSTPPNNARALAFSIAVNVATDYQRKMKVRNRVIVDVEPESGYLPTAQSLEDTGPEKIAIAQQELQLLKAALDELPTDCRTAFLLHSIEGLTQAQIATSMGVSPIKVYRLLVKAMSHCQLRLNRTPDKKQRRNKSDP